MNEKRIFEIRNLKLELESGPLETLKSKIQRFKDSSSIFQPPTSRKSSGFTLVELIIYMALLSAFLLVLTNIFTAVLRVRVDSQSSSSVEQDGRFILARLAYDINRATTDTVPNPTSLNLTISGQTYSYVLNGTNLQLTQPGSLVDSLNGSGSQITSLSFQKIANTGGKEDTIKIQLSLQSSAVAQGATREIRSFSTTVGRRVR